MTARFVRVAAVAVAVALTAFEAGALAQPAPRPGEIAPGQQRTPPRAMRPGEEPPRGTAVLRGYVVAADTGAPIRRAQVRVSAPEARESRITTTDAQGRFEVKELAGGRYAVTASKGGFVTLQYGQRRPAEPGTLVDLPAGQTIERLMIGLPRGSVIAGRIVDEFGEPLTGAQVQVLRYSYVNGTRQLRPAGQSDRTDDQGGFRVFGLPPGEYYVAATLRDDREQRGMRDDDAPTTGYAPTYYPGTTSAAEAQRVTVNLGEEVSGVAFGLTLVPLARVSGRVLGPAGMTPPGPVMAVLDDSARGAGGGPRIGQVGADGSFEVAGLAPGRYVLQVGRGRRMTNDLVGRASVVVAGADVGNVTIPLLTPAIASGRIEIDTGAPPGFRASQVRVSAVSAEPSPPVVGGGSGGTGPVNDDYTFDVRGMNGPSFLRVSPPPGWFLKQILLEADDVTDVPLAFDPGARISGLRVVLTQSAATLSGSVRDDRGAAVLDATVVVFPDDEGQWRPQSRFIHVARPDTSGRYEITGLPGSTAYRVIALQALENGRATDPEFLASIRDRAERLSLAQGETKAVDLRLRN